MYIKTRWMTVHECTSSVYRLKDALLHVLDNHEREISNEAASSFILNTEDMEYVIINLSVLESVPFESGKILGIKKILD
ncbi:unnamed protein product [Rhizophagus irregularis]|nr:unnamed protein product [Rhizophagus irregularis]